MQPNSRLVTLIDFYASKEFLFHHLPSTIINTTITSRPPPKPKWCPPSPSQLEINTYASWTSHCLGIAVIARNSKGHLLAGRAEFITAPSPLFAEALATRLGVHLSSSLQASHFIFEADST